MGMGKFWFRRAVRATLSAVFVMGALAAAGGAATMFGPISPAAPVARKALINASTVNGSPSQEEQVATALGFTVTVVDDTTWGAYAAADFGQYDLLIAGDPSCGSLPAGLVSSAPVYGPVVLGLAGGRTAAGNRTVVGTDVVLHDGGDFTSPGARGTVLREGIAYAASTPGTTGMYFDTTCAANYSGQSAETLAILSAISAGTGTWTIDADPPCGGNVSLIAANPSFSDLTTASLQGWGCSVHEAFPTFTSDWSALAVATDTLSVPTCGIDPGTALNACGEAYVLIAGSSIVVGSQVISVSPLDATNPVATNHTVTANVHAVGGTPVVAGQLVAFTVTGQNNGATGTCVPADCKSAVNGDVSFTYADTNGAGDDTIKASFTDSVGSLQTATAQKHWVAGVSRALTVNVVGSGSVGSSPAGISCPTTCTANFADGVSVGLTPTAAAGFAFTGWSVACAGSGACNVTMDADKSVTATFSAIPPLLTQLEIDGDGRICSPRKIDMHFDDVEQKSSGRLKGEVEFKARDAKFKSRSITALGFAGNTLGLVTGSGKFNGHSGYSFVAIVFDSGRHSGTPDVVAFFVADSSHRTVLSSDGFQPLCKGDVKIHEDHDFYSGS